MSAQPSKGRLLELIGRFDRVRVLAFVDLVADEYIYGTIARVSREAPVLILDYDRSQIVPGGGANAVNNIASLGGMALTLGVVGKDAAGKALMDKLAHNKIRRRLIHRRPGFQTPTKTRILAGGAHSTKQQVVRVDRKTQVASDVETRKHLERAIKVTLPESDVVMVSDYGYGWIQPEFANRLAERATAQGVQSVVDSRSAILDYSGFSSATPNEPEVEAALGVRIGDDLDTLERSGRQLLKRMKCDSLLITRGGDGMALFERRRKTRHISIFGSDEVADVTGAGDTVLSSYALALGAGASTHEAALLANCAGGLVVMKSGTATINRDELAEAVGSLQDASD